MADCESRRIGTLTGIGQIADCNLGTFQCKGPSKQACLQEPLLLHANGIVDPPTQSYVLVPMKGISVAVKQSNPRQCETA
eukprot:14122059-Alexandrium_andersonii.AAC.1